MHPSDTHTLGANGPRVSEVCMLRRPIQLPRIMIFTMHTTTTALPEPHTTVMNFLNLNLLDGDRD
jgi:hypothetical protein